MQSEATTVTVDKRLRVFVSHASQDLAFVRGKLSRLLEAAGIELWCSDANLYLSADWEQQIRGALAAADWIIAVLSPDAARSEWVKAEVHWALDKRKDRVIPVMIQPCDPSDVHLLLGTLQYIDFRESQEAPGEALLSLMQGATVEKRTADDRYECDSTRMLVAAAVTKIRFEVVDAPFSAKELWVTVQHSCTIGRGKSADHRLLDEWASRVHARIAVTRFEEATLVLIEDLGSANGTFVNDERITDPKAIAVGDIVCIGQTRLRLAQVV